MKATLRVISLSVLTMFAACDDSDGHDEETSAVAQESGSSHSNNWKAKLQLKNASSTYAQTSTRPWSLAKTGAVDTVTSTVTWQINATQGPTGARRLVVTGKVNARNNGNVGAPIGNVVVTLKSKQGNQWITRSSNVATATHGDAATSAKTVKGNSVQTITENAASGSLSLANANNNNVISLSPQVVLPASASLDVRFTAAFDNDVLNLPVGTKVRAEVFVSFGNAGNGGKANVDINGNGGIDSYEARVETASANLGDKTVPNAATTTTAVTLADTLADITTTGTATFSNAVFNLGATMGTVRVTYDGGTAGGTIQNCARLTGTGVNLTACDTQAIAAEPFEWADRDMLTHPQQEWGAVPNGTNTASLLITSFNLVYPSSQLELGIAGAAGNSILLTGSAFVLALLPTTGAIGPLLADETNQSTTTSGTFGGDAIALQLDVDFSDAGVTLGALNIPFGDVTLCGIPNLPNLDDLTVRQFLGLVNTLIGGGTSIYTINDLAPITDALTNAFVDGAVSQFAVDHLRIGSCN